MCVRALGEGPRPWAVVHRPRPGLLSATLSREKYCPRGCPPGLRGLHTRGPNVSTAKRPSSCSRLSGTFQTTWPMTPSSSSISNSVDRLSHGSRTQPSHDLPVARPSGVRLPSLSSSHASFLADAQTPLSFCPLAQGLCTHLPLCLRHPFPAQPLPRGPIHDASPCGCPRAWVKQRSHALP